MMLWLHLLSVCMLCRRQLLLQVQQLITQVHQLHDQLNGDTEGSDQQVCCYTVTVYMPAAVFQLLHHAP